MLVFEILLLEADGFLRTLGARFESTASIVPVLDVVFLKFFFSYILLLMESSFVLRLEWVEILKNKNQEE